MKEFCAVYCKFSTGVHALISLGKYVKSFKGKLKEISGGLNYATERNLMIYSKHRRKFNVTMESSDSFSYEKRELKKLNSSISYSQSRSAPPSFFGTFYSKKGLFLARGEVIFYRNEQR